MTIKQLDINIKKSKNILLISHINPDGDTLGSMCAMYFLIKDNYKKNSDMVVVSKLPQLYSFLPNIESAKYAADADMSRVYDLVINLDVASKDRCADAVNLFNKANLTVNIDHHETNDNYADINIVNPNMAATAEVIFNVSENLGWKISKKTAISLYTGILTDTGGFKFSNTTSDTMSCVSKLLSCGINSSEIYQKCYELIQNLYLYL